MTPPQWVIDKAKAEQDKTEGDEVSSDKPIDITYTREMKLGEWERFNITSLTKSDCVLDLLRAMREQQGLSCFFCLYLGRESITKDPSRTIGSLNLTEDDVLVFRFGYYKRPPKRKASEEEETPETSEKKKTKTAAQDAGVASDVPCVTPVL